MVPALELAIAAELENQRPLEMPIDLKIHIAIQQSRVLVHELNRVAQDYRHACELARLIHRNPVTNRLRLPFLSIHARDLHGAELHENAATHYLAEA